MLPGNEVREKRLIRTEPRRRNTRWFDSRYSGINKITKDGGSSGKSTRFPIAIRNDEVPTAVVSAYPHAPERPLSQAVIDNKEKNNLTSSSDSFHNAGADDPQFWKSKTAVALQPKAADPWRQYDKILVVKQGVSAIMARKLSAEGDTFAINETSGRDRESYLYMLRSIRHPVFLDIIEIFA